MVSGVYDRLRSLVRRSGQRELLILLVLSFVAGGLWGFAELADEVIEGETQSFDERVILALRNPHDASDPVGPRWLEEMGRDFTALGGTGVLVFFVFAISVFLWMAGKRRSTGFLLFAVTSGLAISHLLKNFFDRPRPDLVPHLSHVYTASFPSGHSLMAAVVYLTLGSLVAAFVHSKWLKVYAIFLAMTMTVLVGISRVYLGVHYPTDVLAGWTVGSTWALACWLVAQILKFGRRIES